MLLCWAPFLMCHSLLIILRFFVNRGDVLEQKSYIHGKPYKHLQEVGNRSLFLI